MPPDLPIQVNRLDDANASRWDRFVSRHAEGTFFHRAGWRRVIQRAFRHNCYYLFAERGTEIVGVLPLVYVRSRLFSTALISTPFCVYGGPIAKDEFALNALDTQAALLASKLGVDHLEYRLRSPSERHGWQKNATLYAAFSRAIDPDPDVNLKRVPRKQRAMIRKGMRSDLRPQVGAALDDFYGLYAESVRDLGTPVFGRKYFDLLVSEFGEDCEILVVYDGRRPVSTVISFYFGDQVLPYYGGGTTIARQKAAYDFMYWDVMRRACLRGVKTFDFGRSKHGTGAFAFKKNWGFEPNYLSYEYRLFKAKEVPQINPLNPKYRLFINAWKKLPLPVANAVGPHLARSLG